MVDAVNDAWQHRLPAKERTDLDARMYADRILRLAVSGVDTCTHAGFRSRSHGHSHVPIETHIAHAIHGDICTLASNGLCRNDGVLVLY